MIKSNSYKNKLMKNTLIFTIGNFSSRFLIFLLIPIYTRSLSTTEYGYIDLITTTISLILPILTLNIHEAIMRFMLEKDGKQDNILSIGIYVVLFSGLSVIFIAPLIMKVIGAEKYTIYFIIAFIFMALKNNFMYYAKGMEKVKQLVFIGIVDSFITLLLNIYLLMYLHKGIDGYYYSLIISGIVVVVLYIRVLNIKLHNIFVKFEKNILRDMLKYCIPMIPNSLSWWISNTSDKYIVSYFCGVSITGMYSIAYKIPSLLNTVTSVFMQAWQISAVDQYKKDKNEFSNVYNAFFSINILVCTLIIVFTNLIGKIMFSNEFFGAVMFVPILLVAYFFNGLAAYLGSIYTSAKKTNMLFYSTGIGAILNIILNIILVPIIGAYGAAIATLISYFIIWLIRIVNTKKIIQINVNYLVHICEMLAILILAVIFNYNTKMSYIIKLVCVLIIVITNITYIKSMVVLLKNMVNRRTR